MPTLDEIKAMRERQASDEAALHAHYEGHPGCGTTSLEVCGEAAALLAAAEESTRAINAVMKGGA